MKAVLTAPASQSFSTVHIQNPSSFLPLCLETSASLANTLNCEEISKIHDLGLLSVVLEYIWQYSGHFYRWPQQLLTRDDLSDSTREELTINLEDEMGLRGTLPHTQLFWNFAASLDITLPKEQTPGQYMEFILNNATALPAPEAIGQMFANESTPKWRGFAEAFEFQPGVDLEFFEVHSHDLDHCEKLPEGFELHDLPSFWKGSIQYSRQLAGYMDGIRNFSFQ